MRATATLFFVVGVLLGSWASVVPAVSARTQLDHAQLGVALLGMAAGALAGMQGAGPWSARWGAARTSLVTVGVASVVVALPALATSLPSLTIALMVFGAATGSANVAVNALGVELQRTAQRPLMSMLHACFSFGGLAGAMVGGLVAGTLATPLHLTLIGAAALTATVATYPVLTQWATAKVAPEAAAQTYSSRDSSPDPRPLVLMLGAAAACTAVSEGAVTDWGSLHLRQTVGATPSMAAWGFAAFSLAMGSARLAGRRLVLRFDDAPVLVWGAALGAAGMLTAALAPTGAIAIAGFLLAGLGVANVFPLAIGRAGLLGGTQGVARASTVGYTGLLGGPPVIGMLAEIWGLRAAFAAVAGLVLTVAWLATAVEGRLQGRHTVASVLREHARAGLGALARTGERSMRSHGESLRTLLDESEATPVNRPRPISDTFPY
ncbi:MAG: MFS transporter [Ornithinimicrobium sp.]